MMEQVQLRSTKARRFILSLAVILAVLMIGSFTLGRYPVPISELVGYLSSLIVPVKPLWDENLETIILNVRLPRILAAVLVGCCLSAAGSAYQGVFQNPMASPDILGATAGAAFGAALAILMHMPAGVISLWAFIWSLVTVGMIYVISRKARGKQVTTLILAGVMIKSLFSAGTSFLKLVADPADQLPAITYWMMGSFSGMKLDALLPVLPPMAVGLAILFLLRWRLNLLTMGDDEARSMGINVNRLRVYIVLAATLLTAASVSVSGMIGWVGLVIPHLTRRMTGNDYRYLMPASMLFGAAFLLVADNISRNLLATEIPIGILTAFVGAPFFLWLLAGKEAF